MRYKVIIKQKVIADQAADIKASMFALQIIAVSEEENHHYIILIDSLNELSVQFNLNKMLKVNFNAEIDDYVKD